MDNHIISEDSSNEQISLRDTIEKYIFQWPWILLGIFISLSATYVYLRYSTSEYEAVSTILVKDEKKGGMLSELSAFSDMGIGNNLKSNVDNEIEILKSRTLAESTVKKLRLNISLQGNGNVKSSDLYSDSPISVQFLNENFNFYNGSLSLEYISIDSTKFKIKNVADENSTVNYSEVENTYQFGQLIKTALGDLVVKKTPNFNKKNYRDFLSISINVAPVDKVAQSYLSRLKVSPLSKNSSVVEISINDPLINRAEDFINKMIYIYNEDATADKNFISENTSKFIANRLKLLSKELGGVEKDVESFKRTNKLTDIESEAQIFIEGSNDYNKMTVQNQIQLSVVGSMLDFMKKASSSDLLPANLMSNQAEASDLISAYNHLVLERNRILKSATLDNPSVLKLDQEIQSLKSNLAESLRRILSNLTIQMKNLKGQESLFEKKIQKIPVQERIFRDIARQQKVKEELYLYLLTKNEETAISLAATSPNARVIDAARASELPVYPKKLIFYLVAFVLGLLIPLCILGVKDFLDTKVKTRFDLIDKFTIPFLGDVPRADSKHILIDSKSRTSTAEALRIVRSNLGYMLTQAPEDKAKCIFVTSTIPGEGKTFVSVNLASIFAHSGQKVLLIGMDIRKPKLNEYILIKDSRGLTDYLSSKNTDISSYIKPLPGYESFDVLLGGTIPPNPTELLMGKKVDDLFAYLNGLYDYIIVDTAPVSLVSDTLIIAKYADTFAYVVRANYLDKRMLTVPAAIHKDRKLPNMAFVLNDTQGGKVYGYGGYGYGYGTYGYGESEEKKKWYQKILRMIKKEA